MAVGCGEGVRRSGWNGVVLRRGVAVSDESGVVTGREPANVVRVGNPFGVVRASDGRDRHGEIPIDGVGHVGRRVGHGVGRRVGRRVGALLPMPERQRHGAADERNLRLKGVEQHFGGLVEG